MTLMIHKGPPPPFDRIVFERSMPSRLDHKSELIGDLVRILMQREWVPAAEEHWLTLCIDEAVVNAMLHGNEGDPGLDVHIRLWEQGRDWIIQIDDHGEGFSDDQVPDPDDEGSLLLEHGRGILIMQQWLDRLEYYRGGSCIIMRRGKQASERE
ncbi:MAG: ATP-binding protein [Planctomycetota bacterium]